MSPEIFDNWLCRNFSTIWASPVFGDAVIIRSYIADLEGHTCVKPGESDGTFKPMGRREFRAANRLPGY